MLFPFLKPRTHSFLPIFVPSPSYVSSSKKSSWVHCLWSAFFSFTPVSLLWSSLNCFRQNNSTQTALVKFTDNVRFVKIDQRMATLLILFDFSKAFDSVSHSILLNYRLSRLWLVQFLPSWWLIECVRGLMASRTWRLTRLVPQGSGSWDHYSLLFTLMIWSLKHCNHILYADDLQIYLHFPSANLEEALTLIREDISAVTMGYNFVTVL